MQGGTECVRRIEVAGLPTMLNQWSAGFHLEKLSRGVKLEYLRFLGAIDVQD